MLLRMVENRAVRTDACNYTLSLSMRKYPKKIGPDKGFAAADVYLENLTCGELIQQGETFHRRKLIGVRTTGVGKAMSASKITG